MALQHLRSSTANKRPTPAGMSEGQLALNTNDASPGLFFKDSNGALVKVGPVHVGTTAPNATPGSGGSSGNAIGEQWLDTTGGTYVFKVWDGSAWRSESGTFVDVNGDVMTGALGIIAGSAGSPGLYFSGDTNTGLYSPGADQVAISTNGAGRLFVASNGSTTLNSGGNAYALFVESTNAYGSQLQFTESGAARGSIGMGVAVAGTGPQDMVIGYNLANNSKPLIFASNGAERLRITSAGLVGVGTSSPQQALSVTGGVQRNAVTLGTSASPSEETGYIYKFEGASGTQAGLYFINTHNSNNATWLSFKTTTSANVTNTALTIDSSQRVGVGTTSPSSSLHVSGSGTVVQQIQSTGGATELKLIANTQTNASYNNIYSGDGTNWNWRIGGGDGTTNTLTLATGGSERLRIDSSGRVGIGTSTVIWDLEIARGAGSSAYIGVRGNNNTYGNALLIGQDSTGVARLVQEGGNPITFWTGGTAAERMRLDSSGRLGIGTTNASANLHVSASSGTAIKITETNNGVTGALQATSSGPSLGSDTNHPLVFYTNAVEKARLTASGQLLVGTSSSVGFGCSLQVVNDSGLNTEIIRRSADGGGPTCALGKSRGSAGSPTIVNSGDNLGTINFRGYDGSTYREAAFIQAYSEGTPASGTVGGRLSFSTTADSGNSPVERLRITQDGYVRLSTSSPGIQFNGDTALANALDDYEEGTFTPTIVGTSTAGTATYGANGQQGRYTKIGNRVFFDLYLAWSAHTGTGDLQINGLPFTVQNTTNLNRTFSAIFSNVALTAGSIGAAFSSPNTTTIALRQLPTGGGSVATVPMDTSAQISISGSFDV